MVQVTPQKPGFPQAEKMRKKMKEKITMNDQTLHEESDTCEILQAHFLPQSKGRVTHFIEFNTFCLLGPVKHGFYAA